MTTTSFHQRASLLIFVGLTLLMMGCGADGGSSPEAVYDQARSAAESKDWKGLMNCVEPDDRPVLAFTVLLGGSMMSSMPGLMGGGGGATKSEFDAIAKKYGLDTRRSALSGLDMTDQQKMRSAATERLKGVDQSALFSDVMDWMSNQKGAKGKGLAAKLQGDLTDVKIDGDTATGTSGKKNLKFVQVDGSWFLDLM